MRGRWRQVGVAVLLGPWIVRLWRERDEERRQRIRSEERSEMAAHLHDSVLQTLALIQKQAEQPREVKRLARGQERQLREWLYGRIVEDNDQPTTMSAAIAKAAGEVEDSFALAVQQVVVGDCHLDPNLYALVQAAREAMVNAAKHAGVAEVSVYGEVEPDRVTVFVRDRGAGVYRASVPADSRSFGPCRSSSRPPVLAVGSCSSTRCFFSSSMAARNPASPEAIHSFVRSMLASLNMPES